VGVWFNDLMHGDIRHPKVAVSVNSQTVRQVETRRNTHEIPHQLTLDKTNIYIQQNEKNAKRSDTM